MPPCESSSLTGGVAPVPVTPVISVRSVNGEIGDVVLRKLKVGDKFYNGFEAVEIVAKDLGLEKALVYHKSIETESKVLRIMDSASVGEVYYCKENALLYIATGEGEYRTVGGKEYFKDYSLIVDTASRVQLHIDEEFKLTAELFDKNGHSFFMSEPVQIPYDIVEIIKEGYYDAETKEIVFVLANGKEIRVSMGDILENLQPKITEENPLAQYLVEGLVDFKVDIYDKYEQEVAARAEAISAEIVARNNAVAMEAEARTAADQAIIEAFTETLEAAIAKEIADRTEGDRQLTLAINAEMSARRDSIAEEKVARESADAKLREDLDAEVARRGADFGNLDEKIRIEVQERLRSDSEFRQGIADEKAARKLVDGQLSERIDAEVVARVAKEAELEEKIDSTAAGIQQALSDEISDRIESDKALAQSLAEERNNRINNDQNIRGELAAEKSARLENENLIRDALISEESARIAADDVLTKAFNDEAADRRAADEAEKLARETADDLLQQNITAESNARQSEDTAIRNDLAAERTNRISNDQAIRQDLENERTERITNDNIIGNMIDDEATERMEEDAKLQDQIDRIPTYSVIKDEQPMSEQYSATYHLTKTKDGVTENVGAPINIAKDFLVKEAHLRVVEEPDVPYPGAKVGDKYIDLVINVKEGAEEKSHIYLPVQDLVDIYKGDGATIAVDPDNTIHIHPDFLTRISNDEQFMKDERNNRIAQDEILTVRINTTDENLATERANRISNDTDIRENLASEVTRATQEEARIESELTTKIDTDVAEEAKKRKKADDQITLDYTTLVATTRSELEADYTDKIAAEMQIRSDEDIALQAQITENATAIVTEALQRENADNALQAAINQILNRKTDYAQNIIGDGSTVTFTVTHGLGSRNVMVQVMNTNDETVIVDTIRANQNVVNVTFKAAPDMGAKYVVMCHAILGELASVKISFEANGGSGEMAPQYVISGSSVTLPACTFTAPNGMEFDKWAIGSKSGEQYPAGAIYVFNEATVLYALWKVSRGTFYYGNADLQKCIDKDGAALLSDLTATYKSADELLTGGFESYFENGVPTLAISNSLGIAVDKFWTADPSYVGDTYTFVSEGFTFVCNSNDGEEPSRVRDNTKCGATFKRV